MNEPLDRDILFDYLDGNLNAEQTAAFEERLANDEALRAEVEDQRKLQRLLSSAPTMPAPREMRAAIRQRLERESAPRHATPRRRPALWFAQVAALLAVALLGAQVYRMINLNEQNDHLSNSYEHNVARLEERITQTPAPAGTDAYSSDLARGEATVASAEPMAEKDEDTGGMISGMEPETMLRMAGEVESEREIAMASPTPRPEPERTFAPERPEAAAPIEPLMPSYADQSLASQPPARTMQPLGAIAAPAEEMQRPSAGRAEGYGMAASAEGGIAMYGGRLRGNGPERQELAYDGAQALESATPSAPQAPRALGGGRSGAAPAGMRTFVTTPPPAREDSIQSRAMAAAGAREPSPPAEMDMVAADPLYQVPQSDGAVALMARRRESESPDAALQRVRGDVAQALRAIGGQVNEVKTVRLTDGRELQEITATIPEEEADNFVAFLRRGPGYDYQAALNGRPLGQVLEKGETALERNAGIAFFERVVRQPHAAPTPIVSPADRRAPADRRPLGEAIAGIASQALRGREEVRATPTAQKSFSSGGQDRRTQPAPGQMEDAASSPTPSTQRRVTLTVRIISLPPQ